MSHFCDYCGAKLFVSEVCWRCPSRDSDGTATAALCEDIAVPKDCQARAESIAPKGAA